MMGSSRSPASRDFSVVISASARADISEGDSGGGVTSHLIHAVSVSQPVQSWTVIRDHVDFVTVGGALGSVISGLPICPAPPAFGPVGGVEAADIQEIIKVRNELQEWLASVLSHPGATESPVVRQFLCFGANIVPPQFEGLAWVSFSPSLGGESEESDQQVSGGGGGSGTQKNHSLDDMKMDDLFGYEDGGDVDDNEALEDEDDDNDDDDVTYYSASKRYQPTEEAITQDDVMEIQQEADEVEMVDDVGSLAQSLGASHLGRSLQLQAEIEKMNQEKEETQQQGLTIGGAKPSGSGTTSGGIGSAVESASSRIQGLGDSFHKTKPVSAPGLDSFKMIKVIGKGSFGKVFLVREKQTGEMFALKVLRKDNIIKRNQVEHTRTERSVLGYVQHPFIVGLNMAFQSRHKLYFLLDYCAGGELFFHLSKVGKFPEPRARFYAAEIVLAISYVHELDIIYRDLKPENVLLDAKGHVRLTDFGLSKEGITSSSSGATSFCGTPEYLAPEILNRQGHGCAVDWWSLGALLYEMLTGLPPFYCRDREKLFEKIRKGQLEYPQSLSDDAKGLLRGLLTKDPNKRLGSGPSDARDIKAHPFFSEIDWEKLRKGLITPPWDPQIDSSLDTSQFDEEFTSMPMFSPASMQAGFGATPSDNVFEGFTFTDSRFHAPDGNA